MRPMMRFFHEGGFVMWPILVIGLGAIALGAMALASKSRGMALGAIIAAGVVMLLAVFGMLHGRSQVDRALQNVDPAYADQLRAEGRKEANRPLQLGGGLTALGLLLGVAGLQLSKHQP